MSKDLIVRELKSGQRRELRAFVTLPFHIYRDYPLWVPPMQTEIELATDPARHPFYQQGQAAFFLAERAGKAVGRIAAIDNHRYNDYNQSRVGFFHYYEAADDDEVAAALFSHAADWLHTRGLNRMVGPRGLVQGDGTGLLVEGFEHRPAMGIPYNPPYYAGQFERNGLRKLTDFHSGYLPGDYQLDPRVHRIARRVRQRRGYAIKRFASKEELRTWVPRVRSVYNQAFPQSFDGPLGFTPMTEGEAEFMANRILSLARPDLIKLVLQEDSLIGFLFAYPNIGPALRRAGGRLWPLGWLYMLWGLKTTRWLDVNGIGVLPEHQGQGATAVLYSELYKTVAKGRFRHADIVQVREENFKSLGETNALGVSWYKRHRLYHRSLGEGAANGS